MNPRSEPLLWLQLIALGAVPLELLLLLLLLAGADPGPFPWLERSLAWGLGVLAPAVLLWRRPPDLCSLLLVQVPEPARTPQQRRLIALPRPWVLQLTLPVGMGLLLWLLWRFDTAAALATPLSPLQDAPRLVSLLLAAAVLALLLWQWLQLGQALWLLSRSNAVLAGVGPGDGSGPAPSRPLSLGLPLLLLDPLALSSARFSPSPKPVPQTVQSLGRPDPDPSTDPEILSETDADTASAPSRAAVASHEPAPDRDPEAVTPATADAESPLGSEAGVADGWAAAEHEQPGAAPAAPPDLPPAEEPVAGAESSGGSAPGSAFPADVPTPAAIEPEQAAEDEHGAHLDHQIDGGDALAG